MLHNPKYIVYFYDKPNFIQSTGHFYNYCFNYSYAPYHKHEDSDGLTGQIEDRDWLSGYAQLTNIKAFSKVGLFDDDLSPISNEDLDWGIRAIQMGYRLMFVSASVIWHKRSEND